MNNNTHTPEMKNLNTNEAIVLECIQKQAMQSTGGDFTYFDDVMKTTWVGSIMTAAQFKGYLSQLQRKGLLQVEDAKSARPKQIFNIYYPAH
jgi:hypothetical protein